MRTHSTASVLVFAALTSAAVSGAVGFWLRGTDEPAPPVAPHDPVGAHAPPAADLSALHDEIAALRTRVTAVEARSNTPDRVPAEDWVTRQDLTAAIEALRRGPQPGPIDSGPRAQPSREFQQQVAQALDAIQKETVAKKMAAHADQLEDRLASMGKLLQLTPHQTVELRAILMARDEDDRALLALWQQTPDSPLVGERKVANAQRHDSELQRVLTPAQLATWRESQGSSKKAAAAAK